MRLLNTQTLRFEELVEPSSEYAILSHRWENEEVSFQEMQSGSGITKSGHEKVTKFCQLARDSGFARAWIDTCCIDKSSSSELSEAINSMWKWYANPASTCFVYLSDVESVTNLAQSLWFTRGWTLQELIAPTNIFFYNKYWVCIGTKQDLNAVLASATGIDQDLLGGNLDIQSFSVAQKMSWAEMRHTTRIEDRAYCLMGLFDVNMPLIYGEGEKAFVRLQHEIVQQTDDHSIFVWQPTYQDTLANTVHHSMFAPSTANFALCGTVIRAPPLSSPEGHSVTNAGVSIKLTMIPWSMNLYCALLECCHTHKQEERLAIFLHRLSHRGQFARVAFNGAFVKSLTVPQGLPDLWSVDIPVGGHRVLIRQNHIEVPDSDDILYGYRLHLHLRDVSKRQLRTFSHRGDDHSEFCEIPAGYNGTAAALHIPLTHSMDQKIGRKKPKATAIKFGFDYEFNPIIIMALQAFGNYSWNLGPDASNISSDTALDNRWLREIRDGSIGSLEEHSLANIRVLKWPEGSDPTKGITRRTMGYEIKLSLQPCRGTNKAWTVDLTELYRFMW